jgi:uncharacterized protein YndB with AHSA1/START domain
VVRRVEVGISPALAFALWHERLDAWWPKGHSRSGAAGTTVHLEPAVGGRFYERTLDGRELDWGRVEVWDPPRRIVHTWMLGSGEERPTTVEVTFTQAGPARTLVVVNHSPGRLAPETWEARSDRFVRGWSAVLEAFSNAVDQGKETP